MTQIALLILAASAALTVFRRMRRLEKNIKKLTADYEAKLSPGSAVK